MKALNRSAFLGRCQIGRPACLALLLAPAAARAQAREVVLSTPLAASRAPRDTLPEFFRRISKMHIGGSLSLNWRNVGPRRPGFETQIQNEVYLADMYFGVDGPFLDGFPVKMEWHLPTGSRGQLQLNQLYFKYERVENLSLQFGKFIVPFGRYNELYKPDDYLTVTRPLLFASPDTLDLVVRPNSPRPPISSGYTDIGARASYHPPSLHPVMPAEVTVFVVNGIGESTNRQRTFPDPENLGIRAPPTTGVNPDFGHRNNNLADNNNPKSIGGRMVFGAGEVRKPWPFPEETGDLRGVSVGLSALGGLYDLEAYLEQQVYSIDASFDYKGYGFSGEYLYSANHFRSPLATPSGSNLVLPIHQLRDREHIYGYFVQTSFPVLRKPGLGKRVTGVLVFNQAYRRGPLLDFFLNYVDTDGSTIPSLTAIRPDSLRVTRRIDKYTYALNWMLTDHFFLKAEYSYWTMGRSTIRTLNSVGTTDIYQSAFSMVASF